MKKILLPLMLCVLSGGIAFAQEVSVADLKDSAEKKAENAVSEPAVAKVDTAATETKKTALEAATKKEEKSSLEEKSVNPELEKDLQAASSKEEKGETFVTPREDVKTEVAKPDDQPKVVYNPKTRRDPTLSPDDILLLQHREQQRLAAIEAERQRKLAEERRKREEEERLRQLELARIKDPTREVRNKIRIDGIVGQEVFIGDKVYTVGNKIFGARITEVHPDEVVFSYKGHKFVRKMK